MCFSPRHGGGGGVVTLRLGSFNELDTETTTNPVRSNSSSSTTNRNSRNSKFCAPVKVSLEHSLSFKFLVEENGNFVESECVNGRSDGLKIQKQQVPEFYFSPRPVSQLEDASVKVQKFYRSYRTRRNLADCAVVVEELWWKALDFAALKRSSVSFFDCDKPETASSKWARARTRAARVGKGLSKDEKAQKLALQHWLEAIDPRHRYGHNLHFYYDVWFCSESSQPFFYWLDVGDGKEVNLEKCPRTDLQRQFIQYLGPKERQAYEVIIEDGKLVYRQSRILVNTTECSKWIFVLSTTRSLYVGQKKKGRFQHSSFLAGGAATAAGRLVAHDGILEAIWPQSGHYHPTEENFREFISFLQENHVDLTNVKVYASHRPAYFLFVLHLCAIDDDDITSINITEEKQNPQSILVPAKISLSDEANATNTENTNWETTITTVNREENVTNIKNSNMQEGAAVFDLTERLPCKWTTGAGPRIGCVRDYPEGLKSRAMEQVNLSPRVAPGLPLGNYGPIPSPRPSAKVRVSPRLAYMGLPSPGPRLPWLTKPWLQHQKEEWMTR